ncbi:MAG: DUF4231 domain-containing protein [Acidobacteriia bacterium]|nr:DUF4231 domain-containing protein [Terriglobia bacterium]
MESKTLGSMGPEQYMQDRVEQFMRWYDKKARRYKDLYLYMRAITVVGGAIVPVLVNVNIPLKIYATTVISLLVVVLVSLESVFHFREQWKNYRSAEQFIRAEQFHYLTQEGPYKEMDPKDAFCLFVGRVENAIASENAATLNTMTLASETRESGKTRTNSG